MSMMVGISLSLNVSDVETSEMCMECVRNRYIMCGCEEGVMCVTAEAPILNRRWRLGIAFGARDKNSKQTTNLLLCGFTYLRCDLPI